MSKVKELLFAVLEELSKDPASTANMMAKELASIATRYHTTDRDYVNAVTNLVTSRAAAAAEVQQRAVQAGSTGKWGGEWNPSQPGKVKNGGRTKVVSPAVVVDADVPDEHDQQDEGTDDAGVPLHLSSFYGKSEQDVLEHFDGIDGLKDFCRELALELNYRLGAANFLAEFVGYVEEAYGTSAAATEEEE
jgi:hypothetical protein